MVTVVKKVFYVILTLLLWLLLDGETQVLAMNMGFSTTRMELNAQQEFLENIALRRIDDAPRKTAIECFDVNENELIAIGTEIAEKKYVSIYNTEGMFQYGYAFQSNGAFDVQWDADDVLIYFVRSDVAAAFDDRGACIWMRRIENTAENSTYWNHVVRARQKEVGTNRYLVRNDMGVFNLFASAYGQLIKFDETGNETVLYDVTAMQKTRIMTATIGVLLLGACIVWILGRYVLKMREGL